MIRSFLKDSAIYTIPTFVSRGLSFLLVPLYTRVLSPSDYGSLDLLVAFAAIINLTIALEVSQGVARFYAAEKNPQRKVAYASSAFWFTLVCYSLFALIALFLTRHLAGTIMGQPGLEIAYKIGVTHIWANGLFYLIQNQFRWELRSRNYAGVSLLMSLVTAVVSVWLTYFLRWGLEGLLLGMVTGSLSGSLLGLWWLRDSFKFQFDVARLGEMLSFSSPLVFSGIAVWISQYTDRIMINHYLSANEVGLYGIGFRLSSIAGLVMVGFQGALTPLVYAHYHEADTPRQMALIFRLFLMFALLMFLGLSLFAKDILRLFTTEPFYGGSVVVVYLVPAILLAQMSIFAPGIDIAKQTHLHIWINAGGALLNITLNYFLIPLLGIVGAGLATLVSYLCVFMTYIILSQRFYKVPHQWVQIVMAIIFSVILVVWLPYLTVDDSARCALSLLAIVGAAITYVLLGLISPNELWRGAMFVKAQFRRS